MRAWLPVGLLFAFTWSTSAARADDAALEKRVQDLEAAVKKLQAAQAEPPKANVVVGGYVESYYQWNFNEPQNLVTNYRAFDNRHAMVTVENVVLDAQAQYDRLAAHVALQFGETGQTYYAAEPVWRGASGAGSSGPDVWKFIQQATLGWNAPIGRGLLLEAGIFLSPIGPESMAIKDQWNWSRSNLFFALPYYHTGARATYPLTDRLSAAFGVFDGWNDVVDNNGKVSISGQLTYNIKDELSSSLLYFGGVERNPGAPEGQPWRSLFDGWVQYTPTKWLGAMFHADGGFEPNALGDSGWAGGAVYLRVQPLPWMYVAARADAFYEWVPAGAAPIFWSGSRWVTSQTATLDVRPTDHLSVRLEFRHDESESPLYFAGAVATDPATGAWIPNAQSQNTLTLGATAWF